MLRILPLLAFETKKVEYDADFLEDTQKWFQV